MNLTDVDTLRALTSVADAVTSTVVLLLALIWQSRRLVGLSDELARTHAEHKADLRKMEPESAFHGSVKPKE